MECCTHTWMLDGGPKTPCFFHSASCEGVGLLPTVGAVSPRSDDVSPLLSMAAMDSIGQSFVARKETDPLCRCPWSHVEGIATATALRETHHNIILLIICISY